MNQDLAPLRRTQDLLAAGLPADEILGQLRILFGLDFRDGMAALAAVRLLNDRGLAIPEERPRWYVRT